MVSDAVGVGKMKAVVACIVHDRVVCRRGAVISKDVGVVVACEKRCVQWCGDGCGPRKPPIGIRAGLSRCSFTKEDGMCRITGWSDPGSQHGWQRPITCIDTRAVERIFTANSRRP